MPSLTENSSQDIADQGAKIYDRRYRAEFEPKWIGRFAAIDINSEQAFVADFPEEALANARAAQPEHLFYLVRIGSRGAFKISRRVSDAHTRKL
jgi:hypothetical protein